MQVEYFKILVINSLTSIAINENSCICNLTIKASLHSAAL